MLKYKYFFLITDFLWFGLHDQGSIHLKARKGFFLFPTASRPAEAHPTCYPVGTGVKRLQREADH
jgi:hypothetical protein